MDATIDNASRIEYNNTVVMIGTSRTSDDVGGNRPNRTTWRRFRVNTSHLTSAQLGHLIQAGVLSGMISYGQDSLLGFDYPAQGMIIVR